ncbi:MAG TPA: copper homeostasis protein CutC [Pseudonocardiaceae bacterium]|nr:copper homeostasis protein CutC [Pseudonocardiaceae bacterium]
MKIELSVDTLAGVVAADVLGCDRIELCSAGLVGGLTPSHGLIAAAVSRCARVHVLVRPRGGDFTYTAAEIDSMAADVAHAVSLGAAGVVSGALTAGGAVDVGATSALIAAAGGREFTFHRAIDFCADPFTAVDRLSELGAQRVLTSGAAPTAVEGAALLAAMVRRSGTLTVMACGGVRPNNVLDVVAATGVRDVHAAPRRRVGPDHYELDEQVAAQLCELVHGYAGTP